MWSATWGLSVIEPVEARALQGRHLLHALKVGDPLRLARALLFEVAHEAAQGELKESRRTSQLPRRCEELVAQLDTPYTTGLWKFTKGMRAYFTHHFSDALRECDEATAYFRENCTGVAAELMTLKLLVSCSLFYLELT